MSGEDLQSSGLQSAWGLWASSFTTVHGIQSKREPHGRGKGRQLLFPTHLQAASGFPRVGQVGGKETLAAGKRINSFWEGEIPALLDCGTCGDVLNPTVKKWLLVKIHLAVPGSFSSAKRLQLTPKVDDTLKAVLIP